MLTKIIKMCGCSTKVQGASQDRAWIYWKFKHLSFRRRLFHSFVTIKYHVSSGMSQNIQENSTGKTLGFTCKNRVTWSNRVKSCVHYLKHLHKKKAHQYVIAFCCILVSCSVLDANKTDIKKIGAGCKARKLKILRLQVCVKHIVCYYTIILTSYPRYKQVVPWCYCTSYVDLFFLEAWLVGTMRCKKVHFATLSLGPFYYMRWLCHFLLEATFDCEPHRLWRCGVL